MNKKYENVQRNKNGSNKCTKYELEQWNAIFPYQISKD